jgi:hypothetical protein
MSGPESPDAPPPEVPAEFADVYREAYRRALAPGPDVIDERHAEVPEVPSPSAVVVGAQRPRDGRWGRAPWFVPAVVGASALLLVFSAYAVGSALSGDDQRAPDAASPSAAHHPGTGVTPKPPTRATSAAPPGSYRGALAPVAVDAIAADCTAPPGNDSSGRRVTYDPSNAIDEKADTAWRCDGSAVGRKLVLRLDHSVDVGKVGLIPGYAKTDAASGVDRYAENNRITRVRWTLGDGVTVVQRLDPDPSSRVLQAHRVPRTRTDTVTLEILAVQRGPRNTTAISDIVLGAARSS